jgi:hypothetical protein
LDLLFGDLSSISHNRSIPSKLLCDLHVFK